MIDEYGCDENDFICKVNARQALATKPTKTFPDQVPNMDFGQDKAFDGYTARTQEEKDAGLAQVVGMNNQARNSSTGMSDHERDTNMAMSLFGAPGMGTMGTFLANSIEGINPFDTTKTIDPEGKGYGWYKGDTSSTGTPLGPAGSWERGMQGTYGNQYEKDIVGMFGQGSPEHMKAIENQFNAIEKTNEEDSTSKNKSTGFFEGLLGALGIGNTPSDGDNGNQKNGDGGGGVNNGFHGKDHNWN